MCVLVAPFTGVWIETLATLDDTAQIGVAPFTGVWIETHTGKTYHQNTPVAPFTGVWIETKKLGNKKTRARGRALHGRVD